MQVSAGIEKVQAERLRQITAKGFTLDHDLAIRDPEDLLAFALERVEQTCGLMTLESMDAVTYAGEYAIEDPKIRLLAEAGALIAATIDLMLNKKQGSEATSTIGGVWRA